MSEFYMGGATILHPLSREILQPVIQKLFEQIDKECLSCQNSEEFLDALLVGKEPSAEWMVYPENPVDEDDWAYVSVNISVKPVDDKSFKLFFIPNPLCMPVRGETDFSWHFQKLLELTNPLKIGACFFENVTSDDENFFRPKLTEWGVYVAGPYFPIGMVLSSDQIAEEIEYIQKKLEKLVADLCAKGYLINPYHIDDRSIEKPDLILTGKALWGDFIIKYSDRKIWIMPSNAEKPQNIRPYLELLLDVCLSRNSSIPYIEANNMVNKN